MTLEWVCPTHGKATERVSERTGRRYVGCPDCSAFEGYPPEAPPTSFVRSLDRITLTRSDERRPLDDDLPF
jgi:hypothetical protein